MLLITSWDTQRLGTNHKGYEGMIHSCPSVGSRNKSLLEKAKFNLKAGLGLGQAAWTKHGSVGG